MTAMGPLQPYEDRGRRAAFGPESGHFSSTYERKKASVALCMSKDVDELAKRVAHIESPNAPRLISRSIFYWKPRSPHAFKRGINIIDFDRQIRRRRVG